MGKIMYVVGDATNPQGQGKKIICHICNDANKWGAGFVLALSKKWHAPEESYRTMPKDIRVLGRVGIVMVEEDIIVANMIAQHDVKPKNFGSYGNDGKVEVIVPPIRYEALAICLKQVSNVAQIINATLHMPRIGCGLAGGVWEEVQKIIEENVTVDVTVYDLK